jgi:hypothetical protein
MTWLTILSFERELMPIKWRLDAAAADKLSDEALLIAQAGRRTAGGGEGGCTAKCLFSLVSMAR